MNLDLLTNATVADDAIRFVSRSKYKLKSNTNEEDEDQLEEETGEIATTTNQVF